MNLFMTPPVPDQLACTDCHSDNPQLNNFGNIWVGRNNVALVQRAVGSNTGGMGYFSAFYTATDLADIAAWLGNAPSSQSFPLTAAGGTSAAQRIMVSSSTKADLTGLSITVEGEFVIAANECAALLPRLSGCAIDIAFRPTALNGSDVVRTGALVLRHDGTPTPVRLPLRGQVQLRPPAVANLSPLALDFGNAHVGLPGAHRHVRLTNGSSSELKLGAISLTSPAFVVIGGSCHEGLVLAAGRSCLLSVLLMPGTPGVHNGSLIVLHDGVGGQSMVAVAGIADPVPVALLEANPPAFDFGVALPGTVASSMVITISNRGNRAALLRELGSTDASFTIERTSCTPGLSLLPSQRCQIALAWNPTREGAASAELRLSADGAETLRMPLSGLAAETVLQATPTRLAFETVPGSIQERTLRLVNRGSGALPLTALELAGPEAVDFTIGVGSCASAVLLPGGSSCSLWLRFAPLAVGIRLAHLQVSVGGAAAPLRVNLYGKSSADGEPPLMVDAAAMRFADRSLGDAAAAQSLTLNVRGTAPLASPIVRVVGDAAADFPFSDGCAAMEAGASDCSITLRFTPGGVGSRNASLWLGGAAGQTLALVSLEGRATSAAQVLLPAPAAPASHLLWGDALPHFSAAVVGENPSSALVSLSHPGGATSAELSWAIGGPAGADFSIDPTSSCFGTALAAGTRCSLRLWFHPSASGERVAWLRAAPETKLSGLELRGRGLAAARGELRAEPARVIFQARVGAASGAQQVLIGNFGAADVDLTSIDLQGSGFTLMPGGGSPCRVGPQLPGETCTLDLAWTGGAEAIAGGTLAVTAGEAFATTLVPMAVSEDPAQRSNGGAGGGALAWPWLLALLLAGWHLDRAVPPQSRYA